MRYTSRSHLFVFAHPDDELFISGTMMQLIDSGKPVFGVWMTTGDLFGKGTIRINELHAAMDVVGLQTKNRIVFDFEDGGLHNHLERCCEQLTKLIFQLCPSSITVTAFEGGHSDHDILNFAAYRASRESGIECSLREFPLYNGAGSWLAGGLKINSFPDSEGEVKYTKLSTSQIVRKWRAMQCYRSQPRALYPVKIKFMTSFVNRFSEPFRDCPSERDHSSPPYKGEKIYQKWWNSSRIVAFDDIVLKLQELIKS